MKILIGTPIHESKDYCMERWISSLSKLEYPHDLLIVDNSDNTKYVDKVHGYCKKYKVTNYKLVHIDIDPDATLDEKLAQSREIIRREVLAKNYDAWFSLECDIIAPADSLTKLVNLINDYWMVRHTYPARDDPKGINKELGITLVKHGTLEKYGFLNGYGLVDPLQPKSRYSNDVWFIVQIERDTNGKTMIISGIIKPIYHLAK